MRLGDAMANNYFSYLDEKAFLPFLLDNSKNIIEMGYAEFDCDDCRNYWIIKHIDLIKRLPGIICSDNTNVDDVKNFKNCHA